MSRSFRRRWAAGVVLAASALIAGLVPGSAAAAGPDVIQGSKAAAPIPVGRAYGTVGTLDLAVGHWLAYATWTLRIKTPFGTRPTVACQLRAEQNAGTVDVHLTRTDRWIGSFAGDAAMSSGMESIVGGDLDGSGRIVLRCRSTLAGASAQRIRIVALRVPSLGRGTVSSTAPFTVPAGADPTLVVDDSGETLPVEAWKTVASLVLPAGRWWIHGVGTLHDETNDGAWITEEVDCRISLGGRESGSDLPTFLRGLRVHTWDLAAATTDVRGGRTARLRCYGGGLKLSMENLRLVAWPLGRLDTWAAATQVMSTTGAGDPMAIHSAGATHPKIPVQAPLAGTKVIAVPVPAGDWLAKVVFRTSAVVGPDGPTDPGRLSCTWGSGTGDDSAVIPLPGERDRVSMMTTIHAELATTATLRCSVPDALRSQAAQLNDVRATLVSVGGISTLPLD
ncbi:MAG: hypothetical protein U0869_08215 [Chloroflexota bacterium]